MAHNSNVITVTEDRQETTCILPLLKKVNSSALLEYNKRSHFFEAQNKDSFLIEVSSNISVFQVLYFYSAVAVCSANRHPSSSCLK